MLSAVLADMFLVRRITLMGSFAGLQYLQNPGVAFGVTFAPALQIIVIITALFAVLWMARGTREKGEQIAYGLILGGGIANIIDRLRDGLVTDFFQVGSFPVFNVADSCITVGVVMLLLEMLVWRRNAK